jgi:hypothetical protein
VPAPPCILADRHDDNNRWRAAYWDAMVTARGMRSRCSTGGWVWKALTEEQIRSTCRCRNGDIALTCSPPSAMEAMRQPLGSMKDVQLEWGVAQTDRWVTWRHCAGIARSTYSARMYGQCCSCSYLQDWQRLDRGVWPAPPLQHLFWRCKCIQIIVAQFPLKTAFYYQEYPHCNYLPSHLYSIHTLYML